MQPRTRHSSKILDRANQIIHSPHFWILFFITFFILAIYYTSYPVIREKLPWLLEYRLFEFTNNIHGSLLYLPYIYAGFVFGWIGIAAVWILTLSAMLPRLFYFMHNPSALFNNIIFLTGPVMLILLSFIISKWIQSERKNFLEKEKQRQMFMSDILKAHEDERKLIAQELHDDTIQTLLALTNRIQSTLNKDKSSISPAVAQQIDAYSKSVHIVTEDLRRLCAHLRPAVLDDIGLLEALRSLVDSLNNDAINFRLVINGEIKKFTSDVDVVVYRFIQEALNNAYRHSGASEVIVNVDFNPTSTRIVIKDNGKGFISPIRLNEFPQNHKLGLIGMQERANMLHGTFNIASQTGLGTSVYLEF